VVWRSSVGEVVVDAEGLLRGLRAEAGMVGDVDDGDEN
jgi:hypothetical protein